MKGRGPRQKKLRIQDVRWAVLDAGETLKSGLRRRILALGPGAITELVSLYTEMDLLPHHARHAAMLLIDFAVDGQRALLDALLRVPPNSSAHDEAVHLLTELVQMSRR